MPDKLILETVADPECIASDGKVFIEIDGIRKQLKRVKSLTIRADDRGVIEADLTVYAANSWIEVAITRANADAILAVEYGRQLGFITAPEAKTLREWRKEIQRRIDVLDEPARAATMASEGSAALAVIDKIIAELDRREQP